MEENFEDIAPQILSDFKYSKSQINTSNSSATGSPAIKLSEKSFSIHNINNGSNICSKSLLKNLYNFGGIKSAHSSFDNVPYVPTSPIHQSSTSSSFLSKSSFEVPYGNNDYVQISPLNNNNNNNLNYPPLPTIYSTGKSLIPSPPVSLSSSSDSLLGSAADSSSMALSSSPSQSVPSSPPAFSKSYKFNNNSSSSNTNNNSSNSILKQSLLNFNSNNSSSLSAFFSPSSSPSPSAFSPVQKFNSLSISNSNSNSSNNLVNIQCTLNDCLLCQRGQPDILIKSPTWASIMRVVFYTLHQEKDKPFFSLKSDVYDFMTSHWDILCMNKKKSDNWHKQIQDMLSHSKNIFESGIDKYKQNGFWRLKQMTDPWVLPHKGSGRKQQFNCTGNNSSATSSPSTSLSSSPSYLAVPSIQTSPLILSNTPLQNSAFPNNILSNNNSPIKPSQITKLCYEEQPITRKRSSIDMLISSSYNDYDMEPLSSPRKKRLSDSGEIKNYSDLDDEDDEINEINNNKNNTNNQINNIINNDDSDDDVLFIDDSN